MNMPTYKLPLFIKATILIIGLYVLISMLYIGQELIIPVVYAALFAILLNPIVKRLTVWKISRVVAIIITLILAFSILISLFVFLSSQGSKFVTVFPILIDKFYALIDEFVNRISGRFSLSAVAINDYIAKSKVEVMSHMSQYIGSTITTIGGTLAVIFLMPVYIFMILYYQPLLIEFIHRVSGKKNNIMVNEMLVVTKSLIQSYLAGLVIEAVIVAVLYATGLLIIGIEYAILLGIIGALLNIIPYLGGLIAALLYMLVAFTTKDSSSYVLYVLILFVTVHLIDNSYIIPKVVASKVKINALVAITGVLAGGALWGISGMFVSIPLTGVMKVIFDRVDSLHSVGYLLGDAMPVTKAEIKENGRADSK